MLNHKANFPIYFFYFLRDSLSHSIFLLCMINSLVFQSWGYFFPKAKNKWNGSHSKCKSWKEISKKMSYYFNRFVFFWWFQIMKNIVISFLFIHSQHSFSPINGLKTLNCFSKICYTLKFWIFPLNLAPMLRKKFISII